MVTGRFEAYWPPGCIYANWPNYWAYRLLWPWHGWACLYDDREPVPQRLKVIIEEDD